MIWHERDSFLTGGARHTLTTRCHAPSQLEFWMQCLLVAARVLVWLLRVLCESAPDSSHRLHLHLQLGCMTPTSPQAPAQCTLFLLLSGCTPLVSTTTCKQVRNARIAQIRVRQPLLRPCLEPPGLSGKTT